MDIEVVVDSGHRPKRCIVIAIDGARGDYLEGYEAPWVRILAAPGGGFRNAIAANGFASITTGLLPAGPESSNWA